MSYQSKLTIILKMEEKKEKKIQEELRILQQFKDDALRALQKEDENNQVFQEELRKGETVSSSFFSPSKGRLFRLKKEQEINDIQRLIALKNEEYQQIKKKMERLKELDAEREKHYVKEMEKKEERAIEELKTMMKHVEKGGE